MIICVPTQANRDLDSVIYPHFGSAPAFIIHDTESGVTRFLENSHHRHAHGSCNPGSTLQGEAMDVVITGGMGARAVQMLNAMGVRVFIAAAETVDANIQALKNHNLMELTPQHACGHHGNHGGCGHET